MKKNETKYSLEEREWLIAHKDMPRKDLVVAFNARFGRNQTLGALSTFMGKKLGITRKDYHLPYSSEQIAFLRENIYEPRKKLTAMFNERFGCNRSVDAISKYVTTNISVICPENAFNYTDEMLDFLRQYKESGITYVQLASLFNKRFSLNKNKNQICHVCRDRLGFVQRMKSPYDLNEEELMWIYENQTGISREELVSRFNKHFECSISLKQIKNICQYRGWKNGYTGQFGDNSRGEWVPWAKGVNGEDFFKRYKPGYREELREKTSKQFRKYREGDVRVRHGYKMLVTSVSVGDNDTNYESYAKYVWEKAYGKGSVGEDMRFVYLDGNPLNCSLSNLRLVDVDVAMGLIGKNDLYGYKEITDTAIEMLKVKKAVKNIKDIDL